MTTIHDGSAGAKVRGNVTIDVARMKSTRWASPNHVPTASTAPNRSRHRPMDDDRAANVSWLCPTTNTDASDRNQLTDEHANQTNAPRARARTNTRAGCGCDFEDANPARMSAPRNPAQAARVTAARRKCNPVRERNPQRGEVLASLETI